MLVLGIDTSNYATSIAVYSTKTQKIMYDAKRFLPVKQGELGLRQSDALFHHTVALPEMFCEMRKAIGQELISAVGVSSKPRPKHGSYMPCFLAGVSSATAISTACNIPIIETSHQQGHITSALYALGKNELYEAQKLVFHISGGTTELLLCDGLNITDKIGGTTDLYAGQAVDRVGVKLGFSFPAGANLSEIAKQCDEDIKVKVSVKSTECSFSGLENKCNKLIEDGKSKPYIAKFCLLHVAQTVCKIVQVAKKTYINTPVICAGGVMSSEIIQEYVKAELGNVFFVDGKHSSDNAIGVAVYTARELKL